MKKFKLLFATLMLSVAIVGGYQAYEYGNMTEAGSVLLENVEALAASGESGSEGLKCKCDNDPETKDAGCYANGTDSKCDGGLFNSTCRDNDTECV